MAAKLPAAAMHPKERLREYAEVPTRDIAQACGIGERALYRHMASKEDLAVRVFRLPYLDSARQTSSVAPDSATLPEKLSAYLRVMLESFDRDPALIRFLLIHQHETLAQAVRSEDVTPLTAVRGALERAQERGEIPTGDVDLQTAMIMGSALQPMTFISHGRIPAPAMSQHPATLGGLLRCGSKART